MILDDSILELSVPIVPNEPTEDLEYSTWISTGEDYIPAVNLKCVDNIPAGMYACAFVDRDYHLTPIPINSDELFIFSDSYQESILSEIKQFWDKKELYKKYNLCHKRGLLLEGGPGTGKSSLITQVIQHIIELNGVVFTVRNASEFQFLPIILKSIFRKIEPERPVITIIEDVDKLIENLGGDQILLDFMDGKQSINNHLVILTSNNTSELSDALLRPSRIDLRYRLDNPNDNVRKEYFQYKGISDDQLDEYVRLTKNLSIADLKEVFIATVILNKSIDQVVKDIKNPLQKRDYLTQSIKITGF
jgi:ATP-dependent 26S proteasome regulatory subunit